MPSPERICRERWPRRWRQWGDPDVRVRAAAGVVLAGSEDVGAVADRLDALLLDPENTFVTSETALALVARDDAERIRLIASALVRADEDTANWLVDAVTCGHSDAEWRLTVSVLATLVEDDDPDTAAGAARLAAQMPGAEATGGSPGSTS
ncbi:hypothetical protein [Cellulomonas rhizosphaerae]|uniref:HEAT repeat domain-containing protein n=1 Tax=Cellulomonas rhizosphaerae TaxID=2293719 RepID=A0A413RLT6_9CELL|nr:hypothetical protein [Cellulomonas rhizosphaerae]RHA40999.1 hypothetical protein D1825_09170 [Cellulomonas rhizosphaerae]